jgi:hypothetical protein
MVMLTAPSSAEADPLAMPTIHPEPVEPTAPKQDSQMAWAKLVAPLLASRPSVQVVLWNQLADGEAHEFPNGGLFDAKGKARLTLAMLRALRKSCAM